MHKQLHQQVAERRHRYRERCMHVPVPAPPFPLSLSHSAAEKDILMERNEKERKVEVSERRMLGETRLLELALLWDRYDIAKYDLPLSSRM